MPWKWSHKCLGVKAVPKDLSIPAVVKLHGDDYGNFGTGTQLDVDQPLLLYSVRRCFKMLAVNVEWDEKQRTYEEKGSALVIPLTYPGNVPFSAILFRCASMVLVAVWFQNLTLRKQIILRLFISGQVFLRSQPQGTNNTQVWRLDLSVRVCVCVCVYMCAHP